jgi:hypothetical protein
MFGDRPFFLSQPTMVDVDLLEFLEYSNGLDHILTTIEPNLIPAIAAYGASPRFQVRPYLCKDV